MLVGWGRGGGGYGTGSQPRLATKPSCDLQIFPEHLHEPAAGLRAEDVTVEEEGEDSALPLRGVTLVRRNPTMPGRDDCLRRQRKQTERK